MWVFLLKSNLKPDVLNSNIGEVVRPTTDKLQSQLNDTTTMITKTNEVCVETRLTLSQYTNVLNTLPEKQSNTENGVQYCKKIASDTIRKYNQLEQEFDNKKFNENISNCAVLVKCLTKSVEFLRKKYKPKGGML